MKTINKTIDGIKHQFSSKTGANIKKWNFWYDLYDSLWEYSQTIDGVTYHGQRKIWHNHKSGMYYERFILNGIEYTSEVAFARAALAGNNNKVTAD